MHKHRLPPQLPGQLPLVSPLVPPPLDSADMLTARAWHSVTTVGATTGIAPEVAASFSGGGFSNVFSQPSYQAAAVSRYLSTLGGENAGRFNRSGRAYPDIAAQGDNVEIVFMGQRGPVSSTA